MKVPKPVLAFLAILWAASVALTGYFSRSGNARLGETFGRDDGSSPPRADLQGSGSPSKTAGAAAERGGAERRESRAPEAVAGRLEALVTRGTPRAYAEMAVALSEFSAAEAPHAFGFLTSCSRATENMWGCLWRQWGAVDLRAAITQASADSSAGGRDAAIKEIFSGLGDSSPQSAAEYLRLNPEMPARDQALQGLAVQWALNNSAAATEWAFSSLEGEERNNALYAIPWAINLREGSGSELEWWRALPDEESKRAAYGALRDIHDRHGRDPELGISLAEAGIDHGIRDSRLLSGIAADLGARDPERGILLLTRSDPRATDGSAYYTGLDTLFATWGAADAIAAGERLNDVLGEPWADTAILGYARAISAVDPAAAAGWLDQIRDEEIRSRVRR